MHRLIAATLVILLALFTVPAYAQSNRPAIFNSEQEAQNHCPKDVVVWLNLPTGVYHFQGERWYGNTRAGAYVCQKEADASGDRATRNGQ